MRSMRRKATDPASAPVPAGRYRVVIRLGLLLLLAVTILSACPAPEIVRDPPEGVEINVVAPPVPEPPDDVIEVLPDDEAVPPELMPRPALLRQRPEIVEAGWRRTRALAPWTDAARTTLANPAYVAGLYVRAVMAENRALLAGVLHPRSAMPVPGDDDRPDAISDSDAWPKFWWRKRLAVRDAQGVLAWGAPVRASENTATVALLFAPAEPDAATLTVVILESVPPTQAGGSGRWGVLDVQTHLRPDAMALCRPFAAQFPAREPQPQIVPVERLIAAQQRDAETRPPTHPESTFRHVVDILPPLVATFDVIDESIALGIGLGASPGHERELAITVRAEPPASGSDLAHALHAALMDAPNVRIHRVFRGTRTWDGSAWIAEAVVVLDGSVGFPRWYRAVWLSRLDIDDEPAEWRLIAWVPWLTRAELGELGLSTRAHESQESAGD